MGRRALCCFSVPLGRGVEVSLGFDAPFSFLGENILPDQIVATCSAHAPYRQRSVFFKIKQESEN
jgi:hypothetical protein